MMVVAATSQIATLRNRIAKQTRLPVDRLKLVHKGTALLDEHKAPSLADMGAKFLHYAEAECFCAPSQKWIHSGL